MKRVSLVLFIVVLYLPKWEEVGTEWETFSTLSIHEGCEGIGETSLIHVHDMFVQEKGKEGGGGRHFLPHGK